MSGAVSDLGGLCCQLNQRWSFILIDVERGRIEGGEGVVADLKQDHVDSFDQLGLIFDLDEVEHRIEYFLLHDSDDQPEVGALLVLVVPDAEQIPHEG